MSRAPRAPPQLSPRDAQNLGELVWARVGPAAPAPPVRTDGPADHRGQAKPSQNAAVTDGVQRRAKARAVIADADLVNIRTRQALDADLDRVVSAVVSFARGNSILQQLQDAARCEVE